jgi:hypothetical protein
MDFIVAREQRAVIESISSHRIANPGDLIDHAVHLGRVKVSLGHCWNSADCRCRPGGGNWRCGDYAWTGHRMMALPMLLSGLSLCRECLEDPTTTR